MPFSDTLPVAHCPCLRWGKLKYEYVTFSVLRPGKGECADPVNEDAILEKDGGGSPTARIGSVS
jgi:hypothetical protein